MALSSGPILHALARGLLAVEHVDTFSAKRAKLSIEVLLSAADPAVADFAHRIRSRFVDHQKISVSWVFCNGSTLIIFATL